MEVHPFLAGVGHVIVFSAAVVTALDAGDLYLGDLVIFQDPLAFGLFVGMDEYFDDVAEAFQGFGGAVAKKDGASFAGKFLDDLLFF